MTISRRFKRPFIETPGERAAYEYGIRIAASVASEFDRLSIHTHLVSECILGKLNVLKRRPKKNPACEKMDQAILRIERKVDSLEGTMRFMTRHTNYKRSTGRPL